MGDLGPEEFRGSERFRIQRRLGSGGSGVVYEAYDRDRRAVVALKALRRAEPEALYRFKREFRALADLRHPNLVPLYELLSEGGQWFFTMELVRGASFLDHVRGTDGGGPSPEAPTPTVEIVAGTVPGEPSEGSATSPTPAALARLRSALPQLAAGLSTLHAAGKLHRDIKPSNVLVSQEGRLVLVDFGLVSELGPGGMSESGVLQVVGTPSYMSPEQALALPLSEASDWCSVGIMLFAALTGRLPFTGWTLADLAQDRLAWPDPATFVPGLPPDLASLCRALLRRDPRSRPTGSEVARLLADGARGDSRPAVSGRLPVPSRKAVFVGRRAQLAALEAAFEKSRAGQAVTVYVRGASGMGKTALVQRFLEAARENEEAIVLAGRCYERESVPYKALDSLVDALSRHLKGLTSEEAAALLPRDVQALARVFPVLRRVDAVARGRQRPLEVPDLQELRRRAFVALRDLLGRLAEREPVILFIDDLQWGDLDSASLLAELQRPPDPPALLLIACYRSEDAETSPLLRALATKTSGPEDVRELDVQELAREEARELAMALLGEESPSLQTRAEALARESEGSPFLLGELVRHTRETEGAPDRVQESATVDAVLAARFQRLPGGARSLLEMVAVAGQPIALDVARQAAHLESEELEALHALGAAHLVRTRGPQDRPELETTHDRIRQAVVAALDPEQLRQSHRRLAQALEGSGTASEERLAAHLEAAGEGERAAEHAGRAAETAFGALAFARAAQLYRKALELHPPPPDEARRLRLRLADALASAGRGGEAANAYLEAVEGAPSADRLELRRSAAEQFLISGNFDQGLQALREVLASIGIKMARTPRRAFLSLLLRRFLLRIRGLRFRERDAMEIPAEQLIRIDTCWCAATGFAYVDPIRGADFQARHLLLALRAGEPYRVARALALEVGYGALSGGHARERTRRLLGTAQALAERIQHPHALALVTLTAGIAAFLEGDWPRSRELTDKAETLLRERCRGVPWELDIAQINVLLSLFALGELKEFRDRLPGLLKEAEDRGDRYVAASLRTRVSYMLHLAADDADRARQELHEGMARWAQGGFHVQHVWELFAQLEIDLYTGDGRAAWRRISGRWPELARSSLLRIQQTRVWSHYHRAQSALAAAAQGADPGLLHRQAQGDLRRIEEEGAEWAAALAGLLRAGLLAAAGRKVEAAAAYAEAEARLLAVHMGLHARAARRRRGDLLGGAEGETVRAEADSWMASQGVRNPAHLTRMLAP